MSLDVKDAVGTTRVLKTTLNGGEHTPHHIVDGTVAVSGPLTDNQLRATAVPVALDNNSLAALENISVTFPSTQNVSVQNASLAVTGNFFPTTQPVSGTVTVGNTVTVAGTVTANPTGTQNVAGTITANAGTGTFATSSAQLPTVLASDRLKVDGSGVTQPVSGTITADSNRGTLSQPSAPATLSITTAATSQQVFASNASRKYLVVQNLSDTVMYLGVGFTPNSSTPQGLLLSANGGGIVFESNFIPTGAVNIVCATAGKRFQALEG